jgi:hypothetical protein
MAVNTTLKSSGLLINVSISADFLNIFLVKNKFRMGY